MKTINCEVTKVFDRDPSKKTQGFSFRPLEMTEENIQYFQSFDKSKWDNKFKSIACNIFHNNKPNPDWLVEKAQVELDIMNKDGWLNIDIASVKVLKLPEGSFQEDVEQLDDDFVAEELEKELNKEQKKSSQDEKKERMLKRIESLVNNYGEVFKVVNTHDNLVSLDTSLKKDIATHINITLSNEGY
tara:strand:- start:3501 stop:4061 length:561 start_codon:yes stop_codon:yes gene_type:complete